jgi:hypothetical protein
MDVIKSVAVVRPYVLEVEFQDGVKRRINIEPALRGEMFEPLRDPELFRQVTVDRELGTVVWPNGADLSPEYLRTAEAEPIPS